MTRRAVSVVLLAVSMILVGCGTIRDGAGSKTDSRPRPALPAEALEEFADARIFFGHQSVGNNIIHGLDLVYARADLKRPVVMAAADLGDEPRFLAHAMVGVNGNPQSKIDDFKELLSQGIASRSSVVVLKFCYIDVTSGSDVEGIFQAYSDAMADIARRYPHVRVVYTTVPLSTEASLKSRLKATFKGTTPPYTADNIAREKYNSLIRSAYESTGQLFDIARVEATRPDGTQESGVHDGHQYFSLRKEIALDSGHLNDAGSVLAAEEFVRTISGLPKE